MANGEAKSYPMVGGDGPQSYTRNSHGQRAGIDAVKGLIREAISATLDVKNSFFDLSPKVLRVADFGCSVGPNTFTAVQNIVEAVELSLNREEKQENPDSKESIEFQVFFNDHADNDFNTLFKTLPPNRRYFAAGVPGSFHTRVLPCRSLHIGHVSFALHWLSKVPEEVTEWNKKSIHCTGCVTEVVDAYSAQFKRDAEAFLGARARELVPGGLMLILAASHLQNVPTSETLNGMAMDILGSCLFDMAKAGLVSEEKVESFNLPLYLAGVSELQAIMDSHDCFDVECVEAVKNPLAGVPVDVRALASAYRAGFEGLLEEHFGSEIIGELFKRLAGELECRLDDLQRIHNDVVLFALRRKG